MEGKGCCLESTWVRMWIRRRCPLPEPTAPHPLTRTLPASCRLPRSAPTAGSSSLPRSSSLYILDAPTATEASASWCLSACPRPRVRKQGDAAEAPVVRGRRAGRHQEAAQETALSAPGGR